MKKILILEDDKSMLIGISQSLNKQQYETYNALSIKSAWHLISNNTIDMAILDLNLPDGDGILFCRQLRKSTKNSYYNADCQRFGRR